MRMFTTKDMAWIVLLLCHSCEAARILAVVPIPSFSHQLAYRPLWKELSLRGHQVVLLTTDPINDSNLTNLTEISLHGSYQFFSKMDFGDIFTLNDHFAPFTMLRGMIDFSMILIEYQYSLDEVQNLIKNEKFDLVIGEFLNPSTVSFAEKFNCSMITTTSMDAHMILHEIMGNPVHPILYPAQDIAYSTPTTFYQRLLHFIYKCLFKYYFSYAENSLDAVLSGYYKQKMPPVREMMKRIKLNFINANPVFYPTRPLSPVTVNVFGMHLSETKPLPQELDNFLNNATEGAIYVSFGTNVREKQLSGTNIVEIFLETFLELPYKVVWKLDGDHSSINSDKILVRNWYPQRDLLAHKNVKLFITQGGLQSMEEALHCQVPIIGIPFLGDQFNNVLRAQDFGIGLVINRKDLTKDVLKRAVLEVIEQPRYKERITELAQSIEDTPRSAVEEAVWWTEYVLRHKDLSHLKGAASRASLNEYYILDVIIFLTFISATVLIVTSYIVLFATRTTLRLYKHKSNQDKIKKNT